jgi:hypothetical protein
LSLLDALFLLPVFVAFGFSRQIAALATVGLRDSLIFSLHASFMLHFAPLSTLNLLLFSVGRWTQELCCLDPHRFVVIYTNCYCTVHSFFLNNSILRRMRLAVFDLDYTIWQPEMYQMSSAPKLMSVDAFVDKRGKGGLSPAVLKQARTKTEGMVLADKHNSLMRVFDGA